MGSIWQTSNHGPSPCNSPGCNLAPALCTVHPHREETYETITHLSHLWGAAGSGGGTGGAGVRAGGAGGGGGAGDEPVTPVWCKPGSVWRGRPRVDPICMELAGGA